MVLFVPVQTVVEPAMLPPTEAGLTVTVASTELTATQTPLWTTALYLVVVVRLVAVWAVVAFTISTGVAQLSVEYCHLTTLPV